MLLNRHIVLGVCGGIACYKAVDLASKLQQAGAKVDVIMTEHAEEFVRPLTFSTMSHRPVYSDLWEPSGEAAETHIKLAEEADILAIVPATAQTIAKLAHGFTDNMLTTVALATQAPLLLAPAMYKDMYTHPATQANLEVLRQRGAYIVEPAVGLLASGAVGPGRLPDTDLLMGAIRLTLGRRSGDLAGRRVIVTAGGTQEPIDPVRYVGNHSSGKMGYAIATEARDRGADVVLVTGPVSLPAPYGVDLIRVETASQMRDAVMATVHDADALVMSAAVADFRPAHPSPQKIKKHAGEHLAITPPGQQGQATPDADTSGGGFSIHLVRNPDILAELASLQAAQPRSNAGEQPRPRRLVRVGFAAETENVISNARDKLVRKRLDLLVANDVMRSDSGFGADTNKVYFFHADGSMEDLPVMPKAGVAAAIWDRVISLLA
ncbi:bifunctional phosphopantothenoylcysteine decarboxylase/phosphopantothenate--cysteine ligase CoaBC [Ktedonobacter racemifer]|uniref:Coenzyme A biosynthesis bifunctional protein CoaBC n=1 Tax=Ktedonobacter racemifer DSM 44963 TaxID=485913 RepID=D6THU1_KTERA|nr:bifunctional phosphopantothenoylcysteine decarboxylase/phosphopantothenate--cysteine ligase CoaBC [Ktedonobacter racemifer]EFH90911.1 phosphopantothenoylcysteine decarboxylase/phosphopantothenate/cysteine ligase [Ktedonobacter racemifer DSM 44963]